MTTDFCFIERGVRDNHDFSCPRVTSQGTGGVVAVALRHRDIHQNDVRIVQHGRCERIPSAQSNGTFDIFKRQVGDKRVC
jgi:hypothetical protein